jgi:hypothetical protein
MRNRIGSTGGAALGERESGTARLEEAMTAYEACLTVTTVSPEVKWVRDVQTHRDETQAEIARRSAKEVACIN